MKGIAVDAIPFCIVGGVRAPIPLHWVASHPDLSPRQRNRHGVRRRLGAELFPRIDNVHLDGRARNAQLIGQRVLTQPAGEPLQALGLALGQMTV
jgi:hypothetical protein